MVTEVTDACGEHPAVFAGQGRMGQRIAWTVAVWVAPGAVVVPALLVRAGIAGSGVCLLALISPLLGLFALYLALRARHAELVGSDLLTARTVSGRRTVDLQRLVRVRRIEIGGRGRPTDRLLLTDARGVRLAVDGLAGGGRPDEAVAAAIASATSPVAVSRHARRRLVPLSSTVRVGAPGRQVHTGTHAGPRSSTPGVLRSVLLYPLVGLSVTALGIALLFASLVIAGLA